MAAVTVQTIVGGTHTHAKEASGQWGRSSCGDTGVGQILNQLSGVDLQQNFYVKL